MNLPRTPMKRVVVGALLISLAVGALHLFACWYSVAPHGSDFLYKHVSMAVRWLAILALINALYIIVHVVGLLLGSDRTTWLSVGVSAVFSAIILVSMVLIFGFGVHIRNAGYRRITLRGAKLVAAIKQFQAAHGTSPESLDALVPKCLPTIPDTGVAAYPTYDFITNTNSARYGGNRWVLSVDVSTDDLKQDALLYYPDGKYPADLTVKRFGNWALISTPVKSDENQN